ncbi:MAG: hypothetical protein JWQ37_3695 [Blastococcus sp.]|nr:hypothetical protein [Blastococcus sp.]
MRVSRTCPACGYTADYASAPLADASNPRHSCAKHRRDLEQASRRAARLQARVTRECTHPQARHRHGSRAAYVKDRCRCTDCTAANTAASRTATRERLYGRWHPYVDAGPVREHIAALRAAGIGVERIAELAGISVSHIRELAEHSRGDSRRVRPSTATRVMNIKIDDASRAPSSRVDATLYERLWNTRPPRATGEQRAAADAAQAHAAARPHEAGCHRWHGTTSKPIPHRRRRPSNLPSGTASMRSPWNAPSPVTTSPTTTSPRSNNTRSSAASAPAVAQSGTSLPSSAPPSAPSPDDAQPSAPHDHHAAERPDPCLSQDVELTDHEAPPTRPPRTGRSPHCQAELTTFVAVHRGAVRHFTCGFHQP